MKLRVGKLFAIGAPLFLAGCASMGPPRPPSLELPKPPTDLRATRKGDRVTLTWTVPTMSTDRQRMRSVGPTRICRGVDPALKECGTPVGEAPAASGGTAEGETSSSRSKLAATKSEKKNAVQETYADALSAELERANASGWVTYAIEVLGPDGRGGGLSNLVRVPSVAAVLRIKDFDAQITAQGVQVSWRLTAAPGGEMSLSAHCRLRIYRELQGPAEGTPTQERVADLDLQHCVIEPQQTSAAGEAANPTSYLDQHFEWEKTYLYHGTVVTLMAEAGKPEFAFEGTDTPQVTVFAHDVFPPAVPAGLQAVFSGPGQQTFIDLIWAPVMDMDLDGYNVYRHEEGAAPVKVNAGLVKTPSYRDTSVAAGKTYWYSVSAVDVRGNESARSEEASEKVP